MDKVIRDGEVAVIISPGYGSGWSTWDHKRSPFDKELVEALLSDPSKEKATALLKERHPTGYKTADDLVVEWVPVGTRFTIDEYDGSESLRYLSPDDGYVA